VDMGLVGCADCGSEDASADAADANSDACAAGGCTGTCTDLSAHNVSMMVNGCLVWQCCVPDDAGAGGEAGDVGDGPCTNAAACPVGQVCCGPGAAHCQAGPCPSTKDVGPIQLCATSPSASRRATAAVSCRVSRSKGHTPLSASATGAPCPRLVVRAATTAALRTHRPAVEHGEAEGPATRGATVRSCRGWGRRLRCWPSS
jgi:hypothetical protein